MIIHHVILSEKLKKHLRKRPVHIINKLMSWVEAVNTDGLNEVRKTPGYQDEPLHGKRRGERSIRLSRAYRAIYLEKSNGEIEFVEVLEVNKHEY